MIQVIVWLLVLLMGMLAPEQPVEQPVEQHVEQPVEQATTTTTTTMPTGCEQGERSARGYCPGEEGAEQELANLGPCTEAEMLTGMVPPCAGPVPPYLP